MTSPKGNRRDEAPPAFTPVRTKLSLCPESDIADTETADPQRATEVVKEHLEHSGFAVVEFVSLFDIHSQPTAAGMVSNFLTAFGSPLRVFDQEPELWREVGVDTARPPERSRGTGHLPLHMDFVNAEWPPDLVCLLCVRPDPLGGGDSLIASIDRIEQALTRRQVAALSRPVFRDGEVKNLTGVGRDVNPFPVISHGSSFRYRYTGHLLKTLMPTRFSEPLHAAARVLERRTIRVQPRRGHLLILDQHRVVHGRLPVGEGQSEISVDQRRLMLLSFLRTGDSL